MAISKLWGAIILADRSQIFPDLVRVACDYLGKAYSRQLLLHVVSQPAVMNAVVITTGSTGEQIDDQLRLLITNSGLDVDNVIIGAVQSFIET